VSRLCVVPVHLEHSNSREFNPCSLQQMSRSDLYAFILPPGTLATVAIMNRTLQRQQSFQWATNEDGEDVRTTTTAFVAQTCALPFMLPVLETTTVADVHAAAVAWAAACAQKGPSPVCALVPVLCCNVCRGSSQAPGTRTQMLAISPALDAQIRMVPFATSVTSVVCATPLLSVLSSTNGTHSRALARCVALLAAQGCDLVPSATKMLVPPATEQGRPTLLFGGVCIDWGTTVDDRDGAHTPSLPSDIDLFPPLQEGKVEEYKSEEAQFDGAMETDGVDLAQCLDKFNTVEVLGENNRWQCPRCKEAVTAKKSMALWRVPDVVVRHPFCFVLFCEVALHLQHTMLVCFLAVVAFGEPRGLLRP